MLVFYDITLYCMVLKGIGWVSYWLGKHCDIILLGFFLYFVRYENCILHNIVFSYDMKIGIHYIARLTLLDPCPTEEALVGFIL